MIHIETAKRHHQQTIFFNLLPSYLNLCGGKSAENLPKTKFPTGGCEVSIKGSDYVIRAITAFRHLGPITDHLMTGGAGWPPFRHFWVTYALTMALSNMQPAFCPSVKE